MGYAGYAFGSGMWHVHNGVVCLAHTNPDRLCISYFWSSTQTVHDNSAADGDLNVPGLTESDFPNPTLAP